MGEDGGSVRGCSGGPSRRQINGPFVGYVSRSGKRVQQGANRRCMLEEIRLSERRLRGSAPERRLQWREKIVAAAFVVWAHFSAFSLGAYEEDVWNQPEAITEYTVSRARHKKPRIVVLHKVTENGRSSIV